MMLAIPLPLVVVAIFLGEFFRGQELIRYVVIPTTIGAIGGAAAVLAMWPLRTKVRKVILPRLSKAQGRS